MSYAYGLAGGILVGLAAAILLLGTGRIAGISGILAGALERDGDGAWRYFFLGGLLAGGLLLALVRPAVFGVAPGDLPLLAAAGVLVGIGTRLGGGCTSGHGVCGISRFSTRSILATVLFIAAGVVTVFVRARLV